MVVVDHANDPGISSHRQTPNMKKNLTLIAALALLASANTAMAQCPAGQSQVQVSILTDNYGSETTWTLTGVTGAPVYGSGGPYGNNTQYNPTACVPNGPVIRFTIFDSFGDGICCQYGQGNYSVTVNGNVVASGGEFTFNETSYFVAGTPAALDLAAVSLGLADVISQGNTTITGTIRNFGTTAVNNFTLNYSINNGPAVSQPITASIQPGASYNFSHSTPWNATTGTYTVKAWASNPNGQADGNPLNDEMEKTVSVATQSVQRRTLMEQFTSSTCPPCASLENTFGPTLTSVGTNSTGNVAGIKYHLNFPSPGTDPSFNADAQTRRQYYGVNAIPTRFLDAASLNSSQASALNNAAARPAFMDIQINYAVWGGNSISVTATVTPYANFPGTHRLFLAVTEDQYTYTGGTTSQSVFKYVMRKMLPNANGILLSNLQAGISQSFTETFTFNGPPVTQNSNNLWTNLNNCTVVGFVQNMTSRDILQANYTNVNVVSVEENELSRNLIVFPNPSNDVLNVRFDMPAAGTVYMELTNALGQRVLTTGEGFIGGGHLATLDVSSLSPGIYHLTLTSGDMRATRTVTVTR